MNIISDRGLSYQYFTRRIQKDILPNLSEENIEFDPHLKKVRNKRSIDMDLIYDCILLKHHPKITKLGSRKFKLCYKFAIKSRKYSLIIIIKIPKFSKNNIIIKTTYNRSVKRKPEC